MAAIQILSMCLLFIIELSHVISVIGDENNVADACQVAQGIDKGCVPIFQPHFIIQFHLLWTYAFALQPHAFDVRCCKCADIGFQLGRSAVHDENVGGIPFFSAGKNQKYQSNEQASEYGQRDQAGGQHDADGNGPEQEGDIHKVLSMGPKRLVLTLAIRN